MYCAVGCEHGFCCYTTIERDSAAYNLRTMLIYDYTMYWPYSTRRVLTDNS